MRNTLLLCLFFIGKTVFAQIPEYVMTDTIVYDCKGYLTDSNLGLNDIYTNNEDFVFTIESEGIITVIFQNTFEVENNLDFLYVHDGNSTASPLINTFTGTVLPPSFTTSSGAVTFHFTSDNSVGYFGWEIYWTTEVTEPVPPIITINSPSCNSNTLQVQFSDPQLCVLVEEAEISIDGNLELVTAITPVCADDETIALELTLEEEMDYNCTFSVNFRMAIPDQCDSLWYFDIPSSFEVNTCPINAVIYYNTDTLCLGDSTAIGINVPSAACQDYTYLWDNSLAPTAGPHQIGPTTTTTYNCLVTEVSTSLTTTESFTVVVIDHTITGDDIFQCESGNNITLESNTPGGYWYGDGIVDETEGIFNPSAANVGQNTIYYSLFSCTDSIDVFITPIEAGEILAACPGSANFQLEPLPDGGIWSGSFVTPTGLFDPSTIGNYELIYTLNQCTDTLIINVGDLNTTDDLGIYCQSILEQQLVFSPFGGIWSGEGIVDSLFGTFDPGIMAEGAHQFYYEVFGCNQTVDIEILPIYVGSHYQNNCPAQEPFIPTPDFSEPGGYWQGLGITDSISGMYNPDLIENGEWTEFIYYALNGCSDTIRMLNQYTELGLDTLYFCEGDDEMLFNSATVGRTPWGGDWYPNDLFQYLEFEDDAYDGYYFYPTLAGVGNHTIVYENNGCSDSLLAMVYPLELILDSLEFCSTEEPIILQENLPSAGVWSGYGIIGSSQGIFNPGDSLAIEEEDFYVLWTTPAGCNDSIFIHIEEFLQANISGLDSAYCYENNNFPLTLYPDDGTISGPFEGQSFNPVFAGEGHHVLIYEYEGVLCSSTDSITVYVNPELIASMEATDELICPATSSTLTVLNNGGFPDGTLEYEWSEEEFLSLPTNTAIPNETTTYSVIVNDGCSEPDTASITIEVLPPISVSVTTNDIICYDEPGFATGEVLLSGEHQITWGYNGEFDVDTLYTYAGNSTQINVLDTVNGCTFDSIIYLPSFTPIVAYYSINPNEECIPYIQNEITFIDLSEHGVTGIWNFGNGDQQDYIEGINPIITLESGNYSTELYIENEGGCPDSFQFDICVLPSSRIFVPEVFSPNNDGVNDSLYVRGQGIAELQFNVYSQFGMVVFSTKDHTEGWNGENFGMKVPSGIYIYTANILLKNGERLELKGDITLVR